MPVADIGGVSNPPTPPLRSPLPMSSFLAYTQKIFTTTLLQECRQSIMLEQLCIVYCAQWFIDQDHIIDNTRLRLRDLKVAHKPRYCSLYLCVNEFVLNLIKIYDFYFQLIIIFNSGCGSLKSNKQLYPIQYTQYTYLYNMHLLVICLTNILRLECR